MTTSSVLTLFVEQLTTLDFSSICDDGRLTGQSYAVDLYLQGQQHKDGMLLDFGHVKSALKADIESLFDHKLVVPALRNGLHVQENIIEWQDYKQGRYRHEGPDISTCLLPSPTVTRQLLEQTLQDWLKPRWHGEHIQQIRLQLKPESGQGSFFQYSHGLRLHQGACQRIAHGHRSKVLVHTSRGFNPALSQQLADEYNHGYLYDRHCLISKNATGVEVGYTAPEGAFFLLTPPDQAIEMPSDTTIENIAQFMLNQMKGNDVTGIQVYEGFKKGAIAQNSATILPPVQREQCSTP